jgi:branched-chain amino acid transport system ATP-binding protein
MVRRMRFRKTKKSNKPIWEDNKLLLELEDIHTYYGKSHILFGISLNIEKGEGVSLLGRNGAGKSTLFRSIMHMAPIKSGDITFKDTLISKKPTYEIASMGLGLVPQGRRVFADLSVRENLEVVKKRPVPDDKDWTIDKLFELFPILGKLENRMADSLSGGEQQMLAIARTLAGNPELILLDEPTEGLGPLVVEVLGESIEIAKKGDVSVFLAEQNVKFALPICKRCYILEKGKVAWSGEAKGLMEDEETKERFLAI